MSFQDETAELTEEEIQAEVDACAKKVFEMMGSMSTEGDGSFHFGIACGVLAHLFYKEVSGSPEMKDTYEAYLKKTYDLVSAKLDHADDERRGSQGK